MTRTRVACLIAAFGASALSFASNAAAAVRYEYATAPTSKSVAAGSVGFDIFLAEILDGNSTSFIASSGGGLDSAAFKIQFVSGGGAKLTGLDYNPAFGSELNTKSVSDFSGTLNESTAQNAPPVPVANSRVLLGTAIFSAAAGTGPATFRVDLFDGNTGNVFTAGFVSLDADPGDGSFTPLVGGKTFTVAVPEPAGLLLAGVGGVALLTRRRRAAVA
ncbi:MAG TPA: PEP-CTERM sorting domain-containing protein [Tepidisphaeraceae bacterium]